MKTFRLIAFAVSAMLMCVNLSSCGDDDNGDEPPTPEVKKRLVTVTYDRGNDIIQYDTEGRISSVTIQYNDGPYLKTSSDTYTYSDEKITEGDNTYYLKNGLITKWTNEYDDYTVTYQFTYDGNNLVKFTNSYEEIVTFNWKNGNVVSSKEVDTDYYRDFKYEYDTEHYDFGKVAAFLQSNSFLFDDLDPYLIIQGYFGNLPKNMIETIYTTWSDGDEDTDVFYYDYDADGYATYNSWEEVSFEWEVVK